MEISNIDYKPFYFDEYLSERKESLTKIDMVNLSNIDEEKIFYNLCDDVKEYFNQDWEIEQGTKGDNTELLLKRQKEAIMGVQKQVNYFKGKVDEYLKLNSVEDVKYPESSYESLTDAIFHENWGLAGIAKWKTMDECSSAKIIGDRIYFLIDGKQQLQKKRISEERLFQLRKALLLKNPKVRMDSPYAEVYMESGERITIFANERVKEGQAVIIFRKYIVKKFTFEEWADRKSIPKEMIPMLKASVKIQYNVAFVGAVRSGKTTFLSTYQAYEQDNLEGVMVETDPEIPMHLIKPNAPIMQLLTQCKEDYIEIKRELMRTDADYLITAEARDAYALDLAIYMANKGTIGCKLCYHLKFIEDFPYDVANIIISEFGGNLDYQIVKVAKSYQYLYEFIQLSDKSKKRLKGIHEVRYNLDSHSISFHTICKYNYDSDSWTFKNDIGEDKKHIAYESDKKAFNVFSSELEKLEKLFPMKENNVIIPVYGQGLRRA